MKKGQLKNLIKKCELMMPNRKLLAPALTKHYSLGAVFREELNDDIFKLDKE